MANESDRKLIYLDDEGFSFWEHTVQVNGKWTQVTCRKQTGDCPLCESGDRPYLITLFTVIDTKEYMSRDGEKKKNQKKVHALKPNAAANLFNLKDKCNGLKGKGVLVTRNGSKDPASGSLFMVERDKNDKQVSYNLPATDDKFKPFDYMDIFAPKEPNEIRRFMGMPEVSSSRSSGVKSGLHASASDADPIELEPAAPSEASTDMPKTEESASNDVPF